MTKSQMGAIINQFDEANDDIVAQDVRKGVTTPALTEDTPCLVFQVRVQQQNQSGHYRPLSSYKPRKAII